VRLRDRVPYGDGTEEPFSLTAEVTLAMWFALSDPSGDGDEEGSRLSTGSDIFGKTDEPEPEAGLMVCLREGMEAASFLLEVGEVLGLGGSSDWLICWDF
jgi:hypothetical protein